MDKLINEIFKDLSIELDIPDEEGSMLLSKVRSAYREVKGARSYPMDYKDDFICRVVVLIDNEWIEFKAK